MALSNKKIPYIGVLKEQNPLFCNMWVLNAPQGGIFVEKMKNRVVDSGLKGLSTGAESEKTAFVKRAARKKNPVSHIILFLWKKMTLLIGME